LILFSTGTIFQENHLPRKFGTLCDESNMVGHKKKKKNPQKFFFKENENNYFNFEHLFGKK